MHPIDDHLQAQRWIQARLDGALNPAQSRRLEDHLRVCPTCRQYAARCQALDLGLRQHFSARRRTSPDLPPRAVESILNRSRATMNTHRIANFANSLVFGLMMVALAIGLSLFLRSGGLPAGQPRTTPTFQISTTPTATASPTPTATALPAYPAEQPLTDPVEIERVLAGLTELNRQTFLAAAWVHAQSYDLGLEDTIPNYLIDSWTRYGAGCPQSLMAVHSEPGAEALIQLILTLPDGSSADLVALRQGTGQVVAVGGGCPPADSAFAAGALADRLSGRIRVKGPNDLKAAKAWVEGSGPQARLVVQTTFEGEQSTPPRWIETSAFDPATGVLLELRQRMEWADGQLFSASAAAYRYEYLEALPPDAQQLWDESAAELQRYVDGTVPTPTPAAAASISLDDLAVPSDQPLTGPASILQVLEALYARHLAWMSAPGWYAMDPPADDPEQWVSNRHSLTHVLPDGGCEKLVYYVRDGQVLPQEVTRVDGTHAMYDMNQPGVPLVEAAPGEGPCRLEEAESAAWLGNEVAYVRSLQPATQEVEARAWVQALGERRVFVLYLDQALAGDLGTIMDPDTRQLVPLARSQEWKLFDLETGGSLGSQARYELANGKVLGEALGEALDDGTIEAGQYVFRYLSELPADVQQAFDAAVAQLN